MILFNLDRNSGIRLHKQIIKGIVDLIDRGVLKDGMGLPSTRELSSKLGVNRSTVYEAYQELIMLGYLESKPGSYTKVRRRTKVVSPGLDEELRLIDWKKELPSCDEIYESFLKEIEEHPSPSSDCFLDFTRISVDKRLYPIEDFKRSLSNVIVNQGKEILDYGDPCGYLPLRQYLSDRLQMHSISACAENIMITNGSQQALEMLLRLFLSTKKEKKVIIESPTYAEIIPLLRFYSAEVTSVPMLADGMDLDYLERELKKADYSFIYTIPSFHNPTGITSPQSHRERLLHLAEKFRVPVIEDGFDEEMKYFGKIVLPIKSMDKCQIVIYVGTLSKVLFAGMRTGWIVADKELIKRLSAFKKYGDLGVNTLSQAAIDHFCRQGYYDLHIKRMQRIYRRRMHAALDTMQKEFPDNVSWIKPEGGYIIWVSVKGPRIDKKVLRSLMLKNNLAVLSGNKFYFNRMGNNYFRISISQLNEEEIKRGIALLGKTFRELNSCMQKIKRQ
ncbi:MAG: PLP-dependent aminotransferase family protein [Ignavibacteriales bacterium]